MSELSATVVSLADLIGRRCYSNFRISRHVSSLSLADYRQLSLSVAFLTLAEHSTTLPSLSEDLVRVAARTLTRELTGPGSAYYERRRLGTHIPFTQEIVHTSIDQLDDQLDRATWIPRLVHLLSARLNATDFRLLTHAYVDQQSTEQLTRSLLPGVTCKTRARQTLYTRLCRARARARQVLPPVFGQLAESAA